LRLKNAFLSQTESGLNEANAATVSGLTPATVCATAVKKLFQSALVEPVWGVLRNKRPHCSSEIPLKFGLGSCVIACGVISTESKETGWYNLCAVILPFVQPGLPVSDTQRVLAYSSPKGRSAKGKQRLNLPK
jgi:hypothetical protein